MPKLKQSEFALKRERLLKDIEKQRIELDLVHPHDALCKKMGMNPNTYYKKMARGLDFSREELVILFKVLQFTPEMKAEVM